MRWILKNLSLGILFFSLLATPPLKGEEPLMTPQEWDEVRLALREMEELIDQLTLVKLLPEEERETHKTFLRERLKGFEERHLPLFQSFPATKEEELSLYRARVRRQFLESVEPVEEIQVIETQLRLERGRLREGKALQTLAETKGTTEWHLLQKDLYSRAFFLSRLERTLLEGELSALLEKRARKKRGEAATRLEKEGPLLRQEILRLGEEKEEVQLHETDPEVKFLKTSLFNEQSHQAELSLMVLRRGIERADTEERLASPSLQREELARIDRQEREILTQLTHEKELLARKKNFYQQRYDDLKKEGPLSPEPGKSPLGTHLKPSQEGEERLSLAMGLIVITSGQEITAQEEWKRGQELLRLIEENLAQRQGKASVYLKKGIETAVEKARQVSRRAAQAIQTVLKLVNSLKPAKESSRP